MAAKSNASHSAGAFDIRNIIGSLLAIYGLILTIMGLVADKELDKTGGINANLWAGLALLAVGLFFMGWARLKPIRVPDDIEEQTDRDGGRPAHH